MIYMVKTSTTECSETPSAARKTAGKRRLRDFQPLNHIEHGLLPAERPKVSFVAAFSVPRMRASVSSVVLYLGMLKYAGTVPQAIYRQSPMNGKDTSTTILTAILVVALALLTLVGLVWGVVKLSEDSSSPVRALLPWSPR